MAVIKQTDQAAIVPRRVMAHVVERQLRWTWWRGDAAVGTAWTAAMIPNDEPVAGLRYISVALAGWTAGAVIHAVTALPLRFHRAFENIRRANIGRE